MLTLRYACGVRYAMSVMRWSPVCDLSYVVSDMRSPIYGVHDVLEENVPATSSIPQMVYWDVGI